MWLYKRGGAVMLEPFVFDYFSRKRSTLPSWVGWELIVIIAFLAATWWLCGDTVTAFFGGSWDPSRWTLI